MGLFDYVDGWTLAKVVPIVVAAVGIAGDYVVWGSWGKEDVFSFREGNRPATVQRDDLRLGFKDNFYFVKDGRVLKDRELKTDDGKVVTLNWDSYTVKDAK